MPIEWSSATKKTHQWALGSPFLNKILSSSLFVAGVIALLMILLIMVMYPAKSGTSFTVVLKMFVYMFFGSLLVVFLHDGVIKYMMEEDKNEQQSLEFMQNMTQSGRLYDPSYAPLYKPIDITNPTVSGGQPGGGLFTIQPVQTNPPIQINPPVQESPPVPSVIPTQYVMSSIEPTLGGSPPKWKAKPAEKNPYQ